LITTIWLRAALGLFTTGIGLFAVALGLGIISGVRGRLAAGIAIPTFVRIACWCYIASVAIVIGCGLRAFFRSL
jgi:hypothetical protein